MITIELRDIRIFAHHGIYEGEPKIGNEYLVNLSVSYNEGKSNFDSLQGTINYEELYDIVKQRMHINTPLLERICESVIRKIKHQYPFITEVHFSIYKLQAAIQHLEGKVGVTMHKKFND